MATKRDTMGPSIKILQKGRGGVRMVRADGIVSAFELPEPTWKAEQDILHCETCGSKFSFMNRKHHCRRSGIVLCDKCCIKIPLERLAYMDPVRVCAWWKGQTEYENTFFQKSVKTMQRGGTFTLEHKGVKHTGVTAQLSVDDSCLEFSSANAAWTVVRSIPVAHIHMADEKGLVITNKTVGAIKFCTEDQEVLKKWRKAVKQMIKVLHGKPKQEIPPEYATFMKMPGS